MLLPDTVIEIIATKNGKHYKMVMTVEQWKYKERKKKYKYQEYQLGFSQYKLENETKANEPN